MKIIKNLLMLLFMLILTLFLAGTGENISMSVMLSFYVNTALVFFGVISAINKKIFSAATFVWLYMLFFYIIAPLIQYTSHSFPLYISPTDYEIRYINFMIAIFIICYQFAYKNNLFMIKSFSIIGIKSDFKAEEYVPTKLFLCVMWIICDVILVYMVKKAGLNDLIFERNTAVTAIQTDSQATSSLLMYSCRNFVVFTTVAAIYRVRKKKDCHFLLILYLIVFVLTNSPIGMARFQAATIYIGLLVLLFPKVSEKYLFIVLFIFAFIILFPLLDAFRYTSFLETNVIDELTAVFNDLKNGYTGPNYDSVSMFAKVLRYIESYGISHGRQLLAAMFFFIPRSIWKSKPIGSGAMVQQAFGVEGRATNVSCTLPAEGMLNYGIGGIVLFAIALGTVCRILDNVNKKSTLDIESYTYKNTLYPFLPPLFFFIMRGDLLSTTSFTMSYVCISLLVFKLSKIF